jgi:CRP/FNR family transcriptional regulator
MDGNIVTFAPTSSTCGTCRWSKFCVARHAESDQRNGAPKGPLCGAPLRRGTHLFRQGDELKSLYVVRAGSVKCYTDSEDGCEQTIAFQFPGDLLGFDGMGGGAYQSSVVALETTAVCALPLPRGAQAVIESSQVSADLMRAVSSQLIDRQNHALLLGQKSAQARMSTFLLSLSARFAARGCSRTEFNLSMSRQEIANYLAVAVETISRLFSDLQRRGVLAVDRRFVRILSLPKLELMAHEGKGASAAHA